MTERDEYERWLKDGQARGWVGAVVCAVHDGYTLNEYEQHEADNGHLEDLCVPIVRVWWVA